VYILTAVHDPVTYGIDVGEIFDDTLVRVGQHGDGRAHPFLVVGDPALDLLLVGPGRSRQGGALRVSFADPLRTDSSAMSRSWNLIDELRS
jgi:hypothetical protein